MYGIGTAIYENLDKSYYRILKYTVDTALFRIDPRIRICVNGTVLRKVRPRTSRVSTVEHDIAMPAIMVKQVK